MFLYVFTLHLVEDEYIDQSKSINYIDIYNIPMFYKDRLNFLSFSTLT